MKGVFIVSHRKLTRDFHESLAGDFQNGISVSAVYAHAF
jgi:hypothetical protein